ncbi:MAG: hypothetical protein R2698_07340 [Microthrixaceae bacterium]
MRAQRVEHVGGAVEQLHRMGHELPREVDESLENPGVDGPTRERDGGLHHRERARLRAVAEEFEVSPLGLDQRRDGVLAGELDSVR